MQTRGMEMERDVWKLKTGYQGIEFIVFNDGLDLECFTLNYRQYEWLRPYCFGQYDNAFLADDFYRVDH